MSYINVDKFYDDMEKKFHCPPLVGTCSSDNVLLKHLLEDAPKADVVEVKHGKWLRTDAFPHRVYCSECFETYVTNENVIDGRNETIGPTYCTEAEYCPHCGTKMDKE